jgi:hypothetical protein
MYQQGGNAALRLQMEVASLGDSFSVRSERTKMSYRWSRWRSVELNRNT